MKTGQVFVFTRVLKNKPFVILHGPFNNDLWARSVITGLVLQRLSRVPSAAAIVSMLTTGDLAIRIETHH